MSTFLGGLGLLLLQAIGIQAQVTLNEIRMHATETDCWTAVYGEVTSVVCCVQFFSLAIISRQILHFTGL